MVTGKHRRPDGAGPFLTNDHTGLATAAALATEATDRAAADLGIEGTIATLADRVQALEDAQNPPVPVPPVPPVPPTPTPPPVGAPGWWVPPATTTTIPIPSSIDATGATDVTAALRTFIKTVPNGSTVTAQPTAVYKISASIFLGVMMGKSNIIFDWQGATLNNVSPSMPADANSSSSKASSFYWHYTEKPFPTHISIRNLIAKAASPSPGHLTSSEFAATCHFMGGTYFEVANVTASGFFGDFVTLNENAQYVWVHNNKVANTGRNNISVVCGSHLSATDNQFGLAGYCTFDIEPEPGSIAGITDIVFVRNTSGTWLNCYFALDGVNAGKAISDVVFEDNTSTAQLLTVAGPPGIPLSRPQRVSFQRNHGPAGASLKFQHIDHLTVKGNDGNVSLLDCPGAILA